MKNTAVLIEQDGKQIEIFLSEISETANEYIQRFPPNEDGNVQPEWFTSLLHYIYAGVFKPAPHNMDIYDQNSYQRTQKSILNYGDCEGLDKVFNRYIELCAQFKQCPTILGFCTMSGIDKDTITGWKSGRIRNKTDAHLRTTKRWFDICESALAQRAIMSNSIGSIFALKACYSWRETAPLSAAETLPYEHHDDPEQIRARHAGARLPQRPVFDDDTEEG